MTYSAKRLSASTGPRRKSTETSGLLPTPVSNDDNKSPEAHMAMKARMKGGARTTITSLQVAVKAIGTPYSQAASPANLFPKPDEGAERTTTASSGRRCYESYESFLHYGSSLKTCVASLLSEEVWYSSVCALTWKPLVTKSNRLSFQLSPLVRRTGEIGYGLLPTAVANDDNKTPEAHLAMKARMKGGPRKTITSLQVIIKAIGLLPTPRTAEAEGGALTDGQFKDGKFFRQNKKTGVRYGIKVKDALNTVARETGMKTGLKLQPAFVLWMMGYPTDWCDLADGEMPRSKREATALSRKSRKK